MNFRAMTVACASVALISGIVTANLWLELRAQRQVTAGLRTELAESRSVVAEAEARVQVPVPVIEEAPVPAPAVSGSPQAASTRVVIPVPVLQLGESLVIAPGVPMDPAQRQARFDALRAAIAKSYPGLAEHMGLTEEETGRLFDLMAETRMKREAPLELTLTGDLEADLASIMELSQGRQGLQREQGDMIRAMLGEAGYAQWQAYLPTRSVRIEASTYASALAQVGAPLNGAQIDGLVGAMLAEQKSLRQDMVALGRMVDEKNPVSQQQAQAALQNRQAASNQRVLDAVAPQLSAQQLTLLGVQLAQPDAMERAKKRVWERVEVTTARQ